MSVSDVALEISGLTKAFGANSVLRGVDLELHKGEVTVLMGANGAGKSTLVKVICGVHSADSGQISLNGSPFGAQSPQDAIRAGVVTVHQNINDGVIPDLDVAANLMLDEMARPGGGFFLRRKRMRAEARKIAASMQLDVDVTQPVSELGLADRQLVAIARAMAHRPELLIMDEPTSSLSAAEAGRLFTLIDRLRAAGVAILYISHRTSDIRRLADRIVAMRDGQIVGRFSGKPLDYNAAVDAMLGHGMADSRLRHIPAGRPVLTLDALRISPQARPISLSINADEVVVFTGLVGAGKTELANILFGLAPPAGGRMSLNGAPYAPDSPSQAIAAGVFMCPKDRASNGILNDHDLARNITLPFLSRHAILSFTKRASEQRTARASIENLDIVCQSEADEISTLSGGNQQKVMVARWLAERSNLLILDEPFQGVDIQARRDIATKIRETAGGRATIVMASEMDEVLEIADRIVVLSDMSANGDHLTTDLDLKQVLAEVAGAQGADATTEHNKTPGGA